LCSDSDLDWWGGVEPALAMSHTELDHLPSLLGYTLDENWEMTYVAQSYNFKLD